MRTRLKVKEVATRVRDGHKQNYNVRLMFINTTMSGMYNNPYRDVAYSTLAKVAKVLGSQDR